MKNTNIIILIFLIFCCIPQIYTISQNIDSQTNDLDFNIKKSIQFIKKNALILSAIPIILYDYHDIINFIRYRPYINSLLFYLLINYFCDFFLLYQEQQDLYELIQQVKKICFYLVLMHGLKNYVDQENQDQEITKKFYALEKYLSYPLEQTTLTCLKLYQELKTYLQSLNTTLKIESEEFVFLCYPASINLKAIGYLTQNDPHLRNLFIGVQDNHLYFIECMTEDLIIQINNLTADLKINLLKSHINFPIFS